jgi:hypothetical protein
MPFDRSSHFSVTSLEQEMASNIKKVKALNEQLAKEQTKNGQLADFVKRAQKKISLVTKVVKRKIHSIISKLCCILPKHFLTILQTQTLIYNYEELISDNTGISDQEMHTYKHVQI